MRVSGFTSNSGDQNPNTREATDGGGARRINRATDGTPGPEHSSIEGGKSAKSKIKRGGQQGDKVHAKPIKTPNIGVVCWSGPLGNYRKF